MPSEVPQQASEMNEPIEKPSEIAVEQVDPALSIFLYPLHGLFFLALIAGVVSSSYSLWPTVADLLFHKGQLHPSYATYRLLLSVGHGLLFAVGCLIFLRLFRVVDWLMQDQSDRAAAIPVVGLYVWCVSHWVGLGVPVSHPIGLVVVSALFFVLFRLGLSMGIVFWGRPAPYEPVYCRASIMRSPLVVALFLWLALRLLAPVFVWVAPWMGLLMAGWLMWKWPWKQHTPGAMLMVGVVWLAVAPWVSSPYSLQNTAYHSKRSALFTIDSITWDVRLSRDTSMALLRPGRFDESDAKLQASVAVMHMWKALPKGSKFPERVANDIAYANLYRKALSLVYKDPKQGAKELIELFARPVPGSFSPYTPALSELYKDFPSLRPFVRQKVAGVLLLSHMPEVYVAKGKKSVSLSVADLQKRWENKVTTLLNYGSLSGSDWLASTGLGMGFDFYQRVFLKSKASHYDNYAAVVAMLPQLYPRLTAQEKPYVWLFLARRMLNRSYQFPRASLKPLLPFLRRVAQKGSAYEKASLLTLLHTCLYKGMSHGTKAYTLVCLEESQALAGAFSRVKKNAKETVLRAAYERWQKSVRLYLAKWN